MQDTITLKRVLFEEAEKAYALVEKLFRRIKGSDLSWKPVSGRNWMTVGQLLMHISNFGCGKAVSGFVRNDWEIADKPISNESSCVQHIPPASVLPSVESVGQALEQLAEDRILTLECILEVEEADLLSKKIVAPWGGDAVTLFEHLQLMIAHLVQHKGQLFYYLKLMGQDVNSYDLWGE